MGEDAIPPGRRGRLMHLCLPGAPSGQGVQDTRADVPAGERAVRPAAKGRTPAPRELGGP